MSSTSSKPAPPTSGSNGGSPTGTEPSSMLRCPTVEDFLVTAPRAVSFPTVDEFLASSAPVPPKRPNGLFETLLGSVELLYEDAHRHPTKYTDATRELIDRLAAGELTLPQLSDVERQSLDHATIDFASHAPTERRVPVAKLQVSPAAPVEPMETPVEPAPPENPDAYWWLR
jgi:hypothetical protein